MATFNMYITDYRINNIPATRKDIVLYEGDMIEPSVSYVFSGIVPPGFCYGVGCSAYNKDTGERIDFPLVYTYTIEPRANTVRFQPKQLPAGRYEFEFATWLHPENPLMLPKVPSERGDTKYSEIVTVKAAEVPTPTPAPTPAPAPKEEKKEEEKEKMVEVFGQKIPQSALVGAGVLFFLALLISR